MSDVMHTKLSNLSMSWTTAPHDQGTTVTVSVTNIGEGMALSVRLRVLDGNATDILPVHWDDNFVVILPGERRRLTANIEEGSSVGTVVAETLNKQVFEGCERESTQGDIEGG